MATQIVTTVSTVHTGELSTTHLLEFSHEGVDLYSFCATVRDWKDDEGLTLMGISEAERADGTPLAATVYPWLARIAFGELYGTPDAAHVQDQGDNIYAMKV